MAKKSKQTSLTSYLSSSPLALVLFILFLVIAIALMVAQSQKTQTLQSQAAESSDRSKCPNFLNSTDCNAATRTRGPKGDPYNYCHWVDCQASQLPSDKVGCFSSVKSPQAICNGYTSTQAYTCAQKHDSATCAAVVNPENGEARCHWINCANDERDGCYIIKRPAQSVCHETTPTPTPVS